ncbi:MAG TPA: hypothetical protein VE913_17300 [Longimicrobium sp.]|nr:hypothetical protein [Longimicrobium sp.]
MRRTIWTAAVLAVCCVAPAAAQQVEKSPFAPSAATVSVPAAPAETAPAERAPSLQVSAEQIDETIRADKARGEQAPMGSRGWWTTVAAVVVGVVIAAILL